MTPPRLRLRKQACVRLSSLASAKCQHLLADCCTGTAESAVLIVRHAGARRTLGPSCSDERNGHGAGRPESNCKAMHIAKCIAVRALVFVFHPFLAHYRTISVIRLCTAYVIFRLVRSQSHCLCQVFARSTYLIQCLNGPSVALARPTLRCMRRGQEGRVATVGEASWLAGEKHAGQ